CSRLARHSPSSPTRRSSDLGPSSQFGHDPERNRKLLLHRREIDKLRGKIKERGLTLIPLRLYWVKGRAKAELGLGRGKKLHDKRSEEHTSELQSLTNLVCRL